MKKMWTTFMAVALITWLSGSLHAASNLLQNGNLDSPEPGATIDNWSKEEFKTFSGDTNDLITLEPWIEIAPITNGGGDMDLGGFLKAFQGNEETGDLATMHLYQDVPATSGKKYVLTGWIGAGQAYSGLLDGPTQTELAIEFDTDNDRDNGWLADAVLDVQDAGLASGECCDFGAQEFMVMGDAPAGATVVRARVSMIDAYNTTNPDDPSAFIDDFSLVQVPEPATLALFALAGIGLVGFRPRGN